jgi:predicted house-cleaning noncanonical NTP pyrophosphatase (MazG superfamily)
MPRGGDRAADKSEGRAMGKLVRDGIPEIVAAAGGQQNVRVLDDDEYARALLDKLVEEANELRAVTDSATLEEAADVYEVLLAILARQDLNADDLARAAASKRQERGGFERRWWWEPIG